mgnify:CR=1 FL=1
MKKQSELFPTMTSSAEECHVKVGVQQGNKKAQKMTATSGRQCLKLLKAKDPLMLLSRTLMVSSPWEGPTSYQMTWKPKATLRRRLFFQLYPSKLPTEGIESGSSGKKPKSNLWSTPTTFDHTNIKNPRKNHPGGGQKPPLQQQVNTWPTPRVSDTEGGVVKNVEKKNDSYSRVNKKGVRFGVKLKDAVGYEEEKLWPTPIASSSQSASMDASKKEAERLHPKGQNHLAAEMASRTWPTPNASDNRDRGNMSDPAIQRRIKKGKQVGLTMAVKDKPSTGTLNPDWVEWLMGYAPGYSDIDCDKPMHLEDHLGFESEPDIPRITTRKEHRVNRLKCLGNSIVPQIMYEIGNAILADHKAESKK